MIRRLVRRLALPLALGLALPLAVAACSGSGGGSDRKGSSPACPLIAELDQVVAEVSTADVSNPAVFKRTLDDGVARYTATVDRLKDVVPAELQGDLDRIAAAVHQYRFQEAADARPALDAYAATTCGRTPPTVAATTTTSTLGPVSTTSTSTP